MNAHTNDRVGNERNAKMATTAQRIDEKQTTKQQFASETERKYCLMDFFCHNHFVVSTNVFVFGWLWLVGEFLCHKKTLFKNFWLFVLFGKWNWRCKVQIDKSVRHSIGGTEFPSIRIRSTCENCNKNFPIQRYKRVNTMKFHFSSSFTIVPIAHFGCVYSIALVWLIKTFLFSCSSSHVPFGIQFRPYTHTQPVLAQRDTHTHATGYEFCGWQRPVFGTRDRKNLKKWDEIASR